MSHRFIHLNIRRRQITDQEGVITTDTAGNVRRMNAYTNSGNNGNVSLLFV